MRTMVFGVIGDLYIVCSGAREPTDWEWNEYVGHLRAAKPEQVRTLVFSEGGGPNARQRRMLTSWLGGGTTAAAIITSSGVMRGIISTLRWFNPGVSTYPPEATIDAMKSLKIAPHDQAAVWSEAKRLAAQLGIRHFASIDLGLGEPPGKI